MKKFFIIGFVCMLGISCTKSVYLFTGFHEPANAGLRLLYSYDGYKWKDLDTVFLKPMVGDKIMRDPSKETKVSVMQIRKTLFIGVKSV
jgi:hypothetical protein